MVYPGGDCISGAYYFFDRPRQKRNGIKNESQYRLSLFGRIYWCLCIWIEIAIIPSARLMPFKSLSSMSHMVSINTTVSILLLDSIFAWSARAWFCVNSPLVCRLPVQQNNTPTAENTAITVQSPKFKWYFKSQEKSFTPASTKAGFTPLFRFQDRRSWLSALPAVPSPAQPKMASVLHRYAQKTLKTLTATNMLSPTYLHIW